MSDLIQCLECGRSLSQLASHLARVHGLMAREYRARHDLPASQPLACRRIVERQREVTRQRIAEGSFSPDPLSASDAARNAGRGRRTRDDLASQAERARAIQHELIPDGGKRADGRDAARAREAQRRRRARKSDARSPA